MNNNVLLVVETYSYIKNNMIVLHLVLPKCLLVKEMFVELVKKVVVFVVMLKVVKLVTVDYSSNLKLNNVFPNVKTV